MLPGDQKPWAKTVARIVICTTMLGLIVLAFVLKSYNTLHIPEIVGIFLLFLASKQIPQHSSGSKSTVR
jgi:uncharacterized membrane protein YfcA